MFCLDGLGKGKAPKNLLAKSGLLFSDQYSGIVLHGSDDF